MTPLDLLVRVSIVLSAALAIAGLLRRRTAALRHWVLAAGIVGAAVVPAIGALAPAWHLPARAAARQSIAASPVADAAADAAAAVQPRVTIAQRAIVPAAGRRQRPSPVALLGWLWIAGAAAGLLLLSIGLGRLAWIAARAEPFEHERWAAIQDDVARGYGLARRATLLQSDRPLLVTWGVLAPKIIVPRGAADWPDDRIRIVMAHELAHVARGDWLTQLAAELVRAAHWCNPLAWMVCRAVRTESEHACDDAVLNLGIAGSDYASHLLDLARTMHTRRTAWVPAQAIVRPSSLERRVAAMLNARLNRAPLTGAGRVVAAVALALVTVLAAGFSAAQASSSLTGTIVDQLGGALTNATVSLVDLTTNARHDAKSDGTGRYDISGLASGDYMMAVSAPGFQTYKQRVVLNGAPVVHDLRLKLGMIQESLTITNAPPSGLAKPAPNRDALQRKIAAMRERSCDDPGGCIVPPIKLGDKKPVYPDTYTGAGEVVTLKAVIDTTGHVTNLQVVGTASPDLAQAAINAVGQWEFEPTRLDGQVVETEMTVTVNFKSTK